MKLLWSIFIFGSTCAAVVNAAAVEDPGNFDVPKDQSLRGLVLDTQCSDCCSSDSHCSEYEGAFQVYCEDAKCIRDLSEFPSCFSKDSTVQVLGAGDTAINDLIVGDMVFTGHQLETVYGFGHLDREMIASFLEIQSINASKQKSTLKITAAHLISKVESMFLQSRWKLEMF